MKFWKITTYIFLAIVLAGGIALTILTFGYTKESPDQENLPFAVVAGAITGPFMMMLPAVILSYIVFGPDKKNFPKVLKIFTPIITAVVLAGLALIVNYLIPKSADMLENKADAEGFLLISITAAVCALLVAIVFIFFKKEGNGPASYLVLMVLSIPAAFLICMVTFAIKIFGVFIAGAIFIAFLSFVLVNLFKGHHAYGDQCTVDYNGQTRVLTYIGNDEYEDDQGEIWVSFDHGKTAHLRDEL